VTPQDSISKTQINVYIFNNLNIYLSSIPNSARENSTALCPTVFRVLALANASSKIEK
jgi:hypothetical protein